MRKEFAGELTTFLASMTSKYPQPEDRSGRLFKVLIGSYPAITKGEETNE
jgi:hypothetical protein